MKNFKKQFIETAYSKFGVKANESINFEQAFAIIDEMEQCNKHFDSNNEVAVCKTTVKDVCKKCVTHQSSKTTC